MRRKQSPKRERPRLAGRGRTTGDLDETNDAEMRRDHQINLA
jgi:hypothetical protein